MTMRALMAMALTAISIAGCNGAPAPARTVRYFETHDAERKATLNACGKPSSDLQPGGDCDNASRAAYIANIAQDAAAPSTH